MLSIHNNKVAIREAFAGYVCLKHNLLTQGLQHTSGGLSKHAPERHHSTQTAFQQCSAERLCTAPQQGLHRHPANSSAVTQLALCSRGAEQCTPASRPYCSCTAGCGSGLCLKAVPPHSPDSAAGRCHWSWQKWQSRRRSAWPARALAAPYCGPAQIPTAACGDARQGCRCHTQQRAGRAWRAAIDAGDAPAAWQMRQAMSC